MTTYAGSLKLRAKPALCRQAHLLLVQNSLLPMGGLHSHAPAPAPALWVSIKTTKQQQSRNSRLFLEIAYQPQMPGARYCTYRGPPAARQALHGGQGPSCAGSDSSERCGSLISPAKVLSWHLDVAAVPCRLAADPSWLVV